MDNYDIESAIEAILFASGEPVKLSRLAAVLGADEFDIDAAANRLRDSYSFHRRGIRLVKFEDAVQLCSSPEFADHIRRALETRKPPQLSQPALEILSIVAYFGPVTKAYVEQVRGVDSSYTISTLQDRGLIESCGRLAVPGRPMIYRTTHAFLRIFGLASLKDLPELPDVESDADGKEGIRSAILELKARENAETTDNAQVAADDRGAADESSQLSVAGSQGIGDAKDAELIVEGDSEV